MMDTDVQRYRNYLKTGSGSSRVELLFFNDNTATIHVVWHWMGSEKREYTFSCLHQPISDNHGFLRILEIEDQIVGKEVYSEPSIDYGEDVYALHRSLSDLDMAEVEVVYEYIKLQEPEAHFSGDRVLDDMRLTGSAYWNDVFSLFLFLVPFTNVQMETDIHRIVSIPDKAKFEVWIEE